MPDLPTIIDAIQAKPDNERHWLALASWLWDNGRDDEAAVVRVFWPTLRDDVVGGRTIEEVLDQMRRLRRLLGRRAREVEAARDGEGGSFTSRTRSAVWNRCISVGKRFCCRVTLSAPSIKGFEIVQPAGVAVAAFCSFASPLTETINAGFRENEKLTTLRDYLLPRLLSGRVRVRDISSSCEQMEAL